ncbi:hypothetical protein YE105_C0157 [Yersinia enterocolitica subsp. palearctica 105.5R(r)]|uniref:Uncharacterized protein n=1 Tax=Yersinia enterocolitica W22703 TaxID=913028 RepID=F4MWG4_YEREN|nr:hypothetical protein YE105_C0157 [Yersinia enterocolitica subsp. palearctica 105.5R(r)]CBX70172.1 unknown protein [Yersinia enterocolitica W22703]
MGTTFLHSLWINLRELNFTIESQFFKVKMFILLIKLT